MGLNYKFPKHIQNILIEADTVIAKLAGEGHHLLYQSLRIWASQIAPLDAFYIGFYCENNMMVFPYSYDGQEYYDPNKFPYHPQGLSAWILKNTTPYWFNQDGGALLNKGKQFGQLDKRSQDAIVVPLLKPLGKKQPRVIGVMSMQTYAPHSYDETTIRALEQLAKGLVIVLEQEDADKARQESSIFKKPVPSQPMLNPTHVVNQMLEKMQSIRRKAESLKSVLRDSDTELTLVVSELIEECHRRQTETIELFLPSVLTRDMPLFKLSKRELKTLLLLAEGHAKIKGGYTNRDLANKMDLSEDTIKTHLKSIYKKLGVAGRAEAVEAAKSHILNSLI